MIAVHAGAGYHSPALEAAYKRDLAAACRAAAAALAEGGDALSAVAAAIRSLEDSPRCNAGLGSNLSFRGHVECDAGVMDGDGTFGAVAAAPGIRNPVDAAALLARESRLPLSHGRVRPIMLAGDRARQWALSRGLPAAATPAEADALLATEAAERRWRKYRRIVSGGDGGGGSTEDSTGSDVDGAGPAGEHPPPVEGGGQGEGAAPHPAKRSRLFEPSGGGQQARRAGQPVSAAAAPEEQAGGQGQGGGGCLYDTVGCVVLTPCGRVAAGVSSGGIALKQEGRVGEAALYGAGCWAQQGGSSPAVQQEGAEEGEEEGQGAAGEEGRRQAASGGVAWPAVACSVTGVGEHIMRHLLARECCLAAAAASAEGQPAAGGGAPPPAEGGAGGEAPPPLSQLAAGLLRRTVLRGPPPRDCGLLCLRARALDGEEEGEGGEAEGGEGQEAPPGKHPSSSGGHSAAGMVAAAGPLPRAAAAAAPAPPGRQQEDAGRRRRCSVEVAAAHSAQSMAIGHLALQAAGGAGGAQQAAPTVLVLRRAADGGGVAPPVQTYLHGLAVWIQE